MVSSCQSRSGRAGRRGLTSRPLKLHRQGTGFRGAWVGLPAGEAGPRHRRGLPVESRKESIPLVLAILAVGDLDHLAGRCVDLDLMNGLVLGDLYLEQHLAILVFVTGLDGLAADLLLGGSDSRGEGSWRRVQSRELHPVLLVKDVGFSGSRSCLWRCRLRQRRAFLPRSS